MSFFPPDPELPEQDEPESVQPPWWGPPEDEIPALFPVAELLATTEHVGIALIGAFVYRNGVELRLERRLRRNGVPMAEWNELCSTFMEHAPMGGIGDPAGRFRFGLVLGDGSRVLEGWPFAGGGDPSIQPQGHTLTRRQGGGGGGGHSYAATDSLWLWPAPPVGPMELVFQWPAMGIEEQRTILDATRLLALASEARPFWAEPR